MTFSCSKTIKNVRILTRAVRTNGKNRVKIEAVSSRKVHSQIPESQLGFRVWVRRQDPNQAKTEARNSRAKNSNSHGSYRGSMHLPGHFIDLPLDAYRVRSQSGAMRLLLEAGLPVVCFCRGSWSVEYKWATAAAWWQHGVIHYLAPP